MFAGAGLLRVKRLAAERLATLGDSLLEPFLLALRAKLARRDREAFRRVADEVIFRRRLRSRSAPRRSKRLSGRGRGPPFGRPVKACALSRPRAIDGWRPIIVPDQGGPFVPGSAARFLPTFARRTRHSRTGVPSSPFPHLLLPNPTLKIAARRMLEDKGPHPPRSIPAKRDRGLSSAGARRSLTAAALPDWTPAGETRSCGSPIHHLHLQSPTPQRTNPYTIGRRRLCMPARKSETISSTWRRERPLRTGFFGPLIICVIFRISPF